MTEVAIAGIDGKALGRTVAALSALAGLGRGDLAKAAGISYPYLSEIEKGVKIPSAKVLGRIAWALGTTPVELLAAAEQGTVPGAIPAAAPVPAGDPAVEAIVAAVRAVLAAGGTVTMALPK